MPLVNIMLGEVSPGGVGAGLYGMLIFALLSVFIAGLMVGRTPEYLGKKIQAQEMKLVVLYILAVPIAVLGFTGASVLLDTAEASILNTGPHGLTEVTYAFASASNNNGSAFGGLTGNTDWYNTTLGLACSSVASCSSCPCSRSRAAWPASRPRLRRPAPSPPIRRCSPGC